MNRGRDSEKGKGYTDGDRPRAIHGDLVVLLPHLVLRNKRIQKKQAVGGNFKFYFKISFLNSHFKIHYKYEILKYLFILCGVCVGVCGCVWVVVGVVGVCGCVCVLVCSANNIFICIVNKHATTINKQPHTSCRPKIFCISPQNSAVIFVS
jgi:hypothetical protein